MAQRQCFPRQSPELGTLWTCPPTRPPARRSLWSYDDTVWGMTIPACRVFGWRKESSQMSGHHGLGSPNSFCRADSMGRASCFPRTILAAIVIESAGRCRCVRSPFGRQPLGRPQMEQQRRVATPIRRECERTPLPRPDHQLGVGGRFKTKPQSRTLVGAPEQGVLGSRSGVRSPCL